MCFRRGLSSLELRRVVRYKLIDVSYVLTAYIIMAIMEAVSISETITRRNDLEDKLVHTPRRGNLKNHLDVFQFETVAYLQYTEPPLVD